MKHLVLTDENFADLYLERRELPLELGDVFGESIRHKKSGGLEKTAWGAACQPARTAGHSWGRFLTSPPTESGRFADLGGDAFSLHNLRDGCEVRKRPQYLVALNCRAANTILDGSRAWRESKFRDRRFADETRHPVHVLADDDDDRRLRRGPRQARLGRLTRDFSLPDAGSSNPGAPVSFRREPGSSMSRSMRPAHPPSVSEGTSSCLFSVSLQALLP